VAHDLRGPVCSILGLVNIFEKTDCKSEDEKPVKEYVVYAAHKLDQITRELSARIYAADVEMKGEMPVQTNDFSQTSFQ
jgi:hypothetical protein